MLLITVLTLAQVQQIMPAFVQQRALYEARERPSKVYSWQVRRRRPARNCLLPLRRPSSSPI
jgi:ABC-type multidrug transport system permease subunit